jgi:hypothetical protein
MESNITCSSSQSFSTLLSMDLQHFSCRWEEKDWWPVTPVTYTTQKYGFTYRQYKQLSETLSLQCSSFEHFECKMWLRLYFTCHELNMCSSESTGSRRISLFSWDSITLFKQHSKRNHTSPDFVCFQSVKHNSGSHTFFKLRSQI